MKTSLIICILWSIAMGCRPSKGSNSAALEIKSLMQKQENAWNRGDIDGFMETYLPGDSLLFIGSRGLSFGYTQVLFNYKRAYPDRATMGVLHFEIQRLEMLGDNAAFVVGSWKLQRKEDAPGGFFSLLWKKTPRGWKIVADHTS